MFEAFSRSWAYAKTSYGILWDHKRLIVFPILASAAALVVLASFLVPLQGSGALQRWLAAADDETAAAGRTGMYVTAFLFYFCNYFVIVFFNSALIGSTTMWLNGQTPTLAGGLRLAGRRVVQILCWAAVSAVVGVLLRMAESNRKAGRVVALILGSAWTALTYFVVPVIVIDGLGPVGAFKQSLRTLRKTWGTALVGNFSLGLLGILVMLPVFLLAGLLIYAAAGVGWGAAAVVLVVLAVALVAAGAATISAADTVFKALLFSYATERPVPEAVDTSRFADAFVPARER